MRRHQIAAVILAAVTLTSCARYEYNEPEHYDDTDYTRETAGIRLEDDFYGYMNFDFLWNSTIPSGMYRYGTLDKLGVEIDDCLNSEIKRITESGESFRYGSDEQKIRDLYRAFIDEDEREKTGIEPLMPIISEIEKVSDIEGFIAVCGKLSTDYGCSVLMTPCIRQDSIDPTKYAVYLFPMDTIADADALLNSFGVDAEIQKTAEALLTVLNGRDNSLSAYDIVTLLTGIAESTSDIASMSTEELHNLIGDDELSRMFGADSRAVRAAYGIGSDAEIVVPDVEQAEKVGTYLTPENLDVLKNMAILKLLYEYRYFLPAEYSAIFGYSSDRREQNAVSLVKEILAGELGNIYAEKYTDSGAEESAKEMVEEVIEAFRSTISASDNLSEKTKTAYLRKIDSIAVYIGTPEEKYSSVSEIRGGLLRSAVSIKSTAVRENAALYGTVPRHESGMPPQMVNAYYDPSENSITIPCAMLREPVFDKNGDRWENLGKLGSIAAHEISHGFDRNGSMYDETGRYIGAGDPENEERMSRIEAEFTRYFGDSTIMGTYRIDGGLTLNENIPDVCGLSVITSLTDDRESLKKIFESYAEMWAALRTDTEVRSSLRDDVHCPEEIRVNRVLSANEKFYETYGIQPADGMFVPQKDRPEVW